MAELCEILNDWVCMCVCLHMGGRGGMRVAENRSSSFCVLYQSLFLKDKFQIKHKIEGKEREYPY